MSCPTSKRDYLSAAGCLAALKEIERRFRMGEIKDPCLSSRGYLCPCGGWHLSKDPVKRADSDVVYVVAAVAKPNRPKGYYKRQKKLRAQAR